MSCYMCGRRDLSVREYAWTHRHEPHRSVKRAGALMMSLGAFYTVVGIIELLGGPCLCPS